jgi:hypothetical protein
MLLLALDPAQIPIAPEPPARSPIAVSLYGAFLVKQFQQAAHLFPFVGFFVRSESPFLRPDPPLR